MWSIRSFKYAQGYPDEQRYRRHRRHLRGGFTLTEILVVLAIMALLAGLIFAVFPQVRRSGSEVKCIAQMQQIYLALQMYRRDHGKLPPPGSLVVALYPKYLSDRTIFICPLDTDFPHVISAGQPTSMPDDQKLWYLERYTSYSYYNGGMDPDPVGRQHGLLSFAEAYRKRGEELPLLLCGYHRTKVPTDPIVYLVTRRSGQTQKVLRARGEDIAWNDL